MQKDGNEKEPCDELLSNITQQNALIEDYSKPLKNDKLVNILEKFFQENLEEEKVKFLLKSYNRPENCKNINVPQCIPEIWKLNTSKERNTDTLMQKIVLHISKTSYSLFSNVTGCYKIEQTVMMC